MLEKSDHEEADTRIVIHVSHALHAGAMMVLVRTVDSDVVVILIKQFGHFNNISQNCKVFVCFGTGKNKSIIDISQLCNILGPDRSCALPLWVALTGCDSTSSMRGRSKRTAFNAWKNSPDEFTHAMIELMDHHSPC